MIRIADIIQMVCLATGADALDIVSARRGPAQVRPRHIAIYLARACTPATLPEIGTAFRRDHTTVLHAIGRIETDMKSDETLRALVASLQKAIDYRVTLEAVGKIDVLHVARSIALHPRRGGMESSTHELAALAVFALDLWEVASCAEAMAKALVTIDLPEPHDAELPRVQALAAAILDEMNHIAGPAPADQERTDDDNEESKDAG